MIVILQKQHREILTLLAGLEELVRRGSKPFEVLMKLGELSGKVKVHLAQEDQVLYPALLRHKDPGIRETAQKFVQEMGGLAEAFGKFKTRYSSLDGLKENPAQFAAELNKIAAALKKRIQAEDQELYPLAGV